MGFRKALWGAGCGVAFLSALYAFQRPFRQFPGVEYENFEIPAGLAAEGRMGLRPPDVSRPVPTTATPDGSTATGGKAYRSGRRTIRAPTGTSRWRSAA